jgi:hypothetical protein
MSVGYLACHLFQGYVGGGAQRVPKQVFWPVCGVQRFLRGQCRLQRIQRRVKANYDGVTLHMHNAHEHLSGHTCECQLRRKNTLN